MILKEENINKFDAIEMLKIYFSSADYNYKNWFQEITPFKDKKYIYSNSIFKIDITKILILLLRIRDLLKLNIKNEVFTYRWLLFFLSTPSKDETDIKLIIDSKNKVFFRVVKNKKSLFIRRMISLEKWFGRESIKKVCEYYNIYNVIVESSIYWIGFWEKMRKEYKWTINIFIR